MADTRRNEQWLQDLNASGMQQEAAIADLRNLLLRGVTFFFSRNMSDFHGLGREDMMQLAEDCAQDALLAVLRHLADFRGDSKFSTWAYKFGINMALTAARRQRWKGVSIDQLPAFNEDAFFEWVLQDKSDDFAPEQSAMRHEVRSLIRDVIAHDLTERQRWVLTLMVINEVPMDEVVRLVGANRNAIYKLLHDARRRVKAGLQARGFEIADMLALFGAQG
jgi:RNA polymerase sigma-70 factor, ECF subfamily